METRYRQFADSGNRVFDYPGAVTSESSPVVLRTAIGPPFRGDKAALGPSSPLKNGMFGATDFPVGPFETTSGV